MIEILCPICEGDYLVYGRIAPLGIRAYICPECNAFWEDGVKRTAKTHQFFGDWMSEHGLEKANWDLVEKILDD